MNKQRACEKAKSKKLPVQPKTPLTEATDEVDGNGSSESDQILERFEQELCWSIQQLEISSTSKKASPKQGEETLRLLSSLKNPKSSMIKKRQLMRMAFGDYRQKMKDEEKKYVLDVKKMDILSGEKELTKCLFLKKATKEKETSEQFLFNFPNPDESS